MAATAMDQGTGQETELPLQHALPQGALIVPQQGEPTVHLQGHPIVRRHAHQHQTILLQREQVEPGVVEPE
jgi:hypothetical protein